MTIFRTFRIQGYIKTYSSSVLNLSQPFKNNIKRSQSTTGYKSKHVPQVLQIVVSAIKKKT